MQKVGTKVPTSLKELGTRIEECAIAFGGKRKLAQAIGLSENQLYRYINGKAEPGTIKMSEIAQVADVSIEWLILGEGEMIKTPETVSTLVHQPTSELDEELLTLVIERVEERLEDTVNFPTSKKAELIGLIYEELLCQERESGVKTDAKRVDRVIRLSFAS